MPISTSKKANQVFRDPNAIISTKPRRWGQLSEDQKEFWKDRALALIYPDLRGKYELHAEMVSTIAIASYEAFCYYKTGGGEHPSNAEFRESVFDIIDREIKEKLEKENGQA